jgi:hypothetical protein
MHRIQESEVKDALKRMKGCKVIGPDGIPTKVWRSFRDVAIIWLTKLFNLIFWSNKIPDEWRQSILVPIFKNKGDVQNCNNYQGIKLINEPYNEAMEEYHWTSLEGSYQCHQTPYWFYAGEIDYGCYFLDKATYEEMYGAKERLAYGLY